MQTSESHGQEENDIDVSNGGSCKYKTETPRARVIEVHMAGFVVQLDSATLGSRAGSDQHASLLANSKSEYQDINSSFALYGCSLLTMLCRPILMFVVMFVVVLAAEDVTRDVRGVCSAGSAGEANRKAKPVVGATSQTGAPPSIPLPLQPLWSQDDDNDEDHSLDNICRANQYHDITYTHHHDPAHTHYDIAFTYHNIARGYYDVAGTLYHDIARGYHYDIAGTHYHDIARGYHYDIAGTHYHDIAGAYHYDIAGTHYHDIAGAYHYDIAGAYYDPAGAYHYDSDKYDA
eukprot:s3010_g9.t1